MEAIHPFGDLLVLFITSTIAVIICSALRQPAIAGYLLAGALVGPNGLGVISETERVQPLAELGVVLLLFSLGAEFSFRQIRPLARAFFGLGGAQCLLTLIVTALLLWGYGRTPASAVVWGAIISLSSTALVLKLLEERRSAGSLHGQLMIAVLLFQDLWVVPIMAVLPSLAIIDEGLPQLSLLKPLVIAVALIAAAAIASRYFVGWIFQLIARTRVRELFIMAVFSLGVGVALLTASLGLSAALGAFLAGVMLADSSFRHQALADILPLRDPFLALFFVSVGMLIDVQFIADNLALVLLSALLVMTLKFVTTAFPATVLGYSSGTAAIVGLSLAQIGEFSLVVAQQAAAMGILTQFDVQLVLSITLVLFVVGPWVFELAPRLGPRLGTLDPLHLLLRQQRAGRGARDPGAARARTFAGACGNRRIRPQRPGAGADSDQARDSMDCAGPQSRYGGAR